MLRKIQAEDRTLISYEDECVLGPKFIEHLITQLNWAWSIFGLVVL